MLPKSRALRKQTLTSIIGWPEHSLSADPCRSTDWGSLGMTTVVKRSRAVKRVRVGFQGEFGAFHEQAVRKLVRKPFEAVPLATFPELFRALARKRIDYAVSAIENNLAGSLHENYDLLLKYRLPIIAETNIRIVHNLIAPKGVSLRAIRQV